MAGIKRALISVSDKTGVIELATKVPPNFRASRSLARALSRYVERRLTFSLQRRNEIAARIRTSSAPTHGSSVVVSSREESTG